MTSRESTPGFKRHLVILNAETRSLKRASLTLKRMHQFHVSPNTIERICQEVGEDLAAAQANDWRGVLTGEIPVPELAIVENEGGRARTGLMNCGPGVHLEGKGWNETPPPLPRTPPWFPHYPPPIACRTSSVMDYNS